MTAISWFMFIPVPLAKASAMNAPIIFVRSRVMMVSTATSERLSAKSRAAAFAMFISDLTRVMSMQ